MYSFKLREPTTEEKKAIKIIYLKNLVKNNKKKNIKYEFSKQNTPISSSSSSNREMDRITIITFL